MPDWAEDSSDSLLVELCREHGVAPELIRDLLDIEREYQLGERRHGIYDHIRDCIRSAVDRREAAR